MSLMYLEENSQGYFRVVLPNGKIMMDSDLMMAMSCNHVSKPMYYGTRASAMQGYAYYKQLREKTGIPFKEVIIHDDFKKTTC